jgi:hypothetical protein
MRPVKRRNLATSLRQRTADHPMRAFDSLPAQLRRWLADARLPWSPRSALRVWERALARHGGDIEAALKSLDRAEARTLARDLPRIWGQSHPLVTARARSPRRRAVD